MIFKNLQAAGENIRRANEKLAVAGFAQAWKIDDVFDDVFKYVKLIGIPLVGGG